MKLNAREKELLKKVLNVLYIVIGIVAIFLIWYILAITINNSLFPTPTEVLNLYFNYFATSELYIAIGWTFLRLILSFLLSFAIGFIFGILAGEFHIIRLILKPLVLILKTVPTAAVILILIVLFKPFMSLFLIVFLVMFPIIYEAVINGYESLDKNIVNSIKVDAGLHNIKAILNIKIPNLIPYLLLASFQTLGLGMKVSLMAEVLIGNNSIHGLGILIRQAYNFAFVDQIMAYSLHAIVIIGLVDIIMYFLKRYLKNKYSF